MTTQLEKVDATKIPGNATLSVKEHIARTLDYARAGESGFALSILKRLEVIDISIVPKAGEPSMRESRVIFELDVTEGAWLCLSQRYSCTQTEHYTYRHGQLQRLHPRRLLGLSH